jgi:imidazolonepropionase-like amidohydrolase
MKRIPFTLLCAALMLAVDHLAGGQYLTPEAPIMRPPVRVLVITNVNVIDVQQGEVLSNRMVVVQDGYITSIGTRAPAGRAVLRLDGRGKYLIPGLWDTHVQAPATPVREQELLQNLVANGITSISYFSNLASHPTLLATVRAVEAGQQVGPRIQLAGYGSGWEALRLSYGSDLLAEMNRLVAAGQTPAEALQAATILPATTAGYRYTLGQVAPTFRADLVLLDANPLENIRHVQQVRAVVLRGYTFDRAALDALTKKAQAKPPLNAKALMTP